LNLIKKRGNSYGLSLLAKKYLLTDSPYSQHAIWLHNAALYEKWGKLFDVVKTGKPIQWDEVSTDLQADEQSFARAMASTASFLARETAEAIDLRNTKTMLDIGGGPGIYAIEFAKRQPELKVTIMDNAPTLEVARENIKKAGLLDRIELKPGNALTDDLGASYDLILMSNVIHQYSNEENTKLIKRAAKALNNGGCLYVKDFILNPSRITPIKASLFAINMLVNTEKGNCYTVDDIKAWLKSAGLKPSGVILLQPPTKIVIGRKK
ncbi:MAG TPA: methyltransferase, partial [Verrucomicrobiota bacterium]|nr:methyltransferase [Verrucomicrobiota bacterium]